MYSRHDACELMNRWGGEGQPFAFALPYGEGDCLVAPAGRQGDSGFYYCMPGVCCLPPSLPPLPDKVSWQPEPISREAYGRAFASLRRHLLRGDSYLANLCFATPVRTNLLPEHLFAYARAPYKMLAMGRFACFSPEAFVQMEGNCIRTSPMKGTAPSRAAAEALMANEKEAREHATVVDLLRNDLAMVASRVRVERYRYLSPITTCRGELWATSSDIAATLPPDWRTRLGSILFTLLPAGSVTGAPKAWTCRALEEAEPLPRGFYTGIFGYFDGCRLQSAVSIRFAEVAGEGRLLFRSGGGITVLSDAEAEYEELNQKIYVPFAF